MSEINTCDVGCEVQFPHLIVFEQSCDNFFIFCNLNFMKKIEYFICKDKISSICLYKHFEYANISIKSIS